jgi:hypothetical protein
MDRPLDGAADDLGVAMVLGGVLDQRRNQQRLVDHRRAHSAPPGRSDGLVLPNIHGVDIGFKRPSMAARATQRDVTPVTMPRRRASLA